MYAISDSNFFDGPKTAHNLDQGQRLTVKNDSVLDLTIVSRERYFCSGTSKSHCRWPELVADNKRCWRTTKTYQKAGWRFPRTVCIVLWSDGLLGGKRRTSTSFTHQQEQPTPEKKRRTCSIESRQENGGGQRRQITGVAVTR